MLTQLRVKNYALIKDLVFEPGPSFNVITGETGAGKSILLGAMGLILGERTESVAVKENEDKCVVEGYFQIKGYDLDAWLEENEFDAGDELILRREISVNGKSRAFINDTPAQLSHLKELGKYLVDIHSQHDNLDLFQKSFQFRVLDSFAGTSALKSNFDLRFRELKKLRTQLAGLEEQERSGSEERDFKQYLLEELEEANLVEGETEKLEEELKWLTSADTNIQTLATLQNQLNEADTSALDQLSLIRSQLSSVAKNDKRFEELSVRLDEMYYSLKDIAGDLEKLAQASHADPERLEQVNQRLGQLHQLSTKHRTADLIGKLHALREDIDQYAGLKEEIARCAEQTYLAETACEELANELSTRRGEESAHLESSVNELLADLGMPGARIRVEVIRKQDSTLGTYGFDDMNILYSPAEGKLFNPIQNIASGGEISRVMLILKAILARKNIMPTLIFDEIDSGISGEVAFRMGSVLEGMAAKMQLIVITHLPQIASKGKRHFYVFKKHIHGTAVSDMKELNNDERIQEIAEMMGGKAFGDAILESAKQWLSN